MTNKKDQRDKIAWKEKIEAVQEYIEDHSRVVCTVALVVCLGITMTIGLISNQHNTGEVETVGADGQVEADSTLQVPDVPLEENAYPAINELMTGYYKAMAEGDVEKIQTLVRPVSDTFLIKLQEFAKYIESYPAVNVYTKPGPEENSYLVFTYTEVQMIGYERAVPGLVTYYVCQDGNGEYYINMQEELTEEVAQYIHEIDLQDDVIDLNNKVSVEFNNLLAEDEDFAAYYADVDTQIATSVSAALHAKAQEELEEVPQVLEEEPQNVTVTKTVKATDVVNMRMSDSEKADKVGKAQIGDVFTVLEEKSNGWTKVQYENQEVFIKSDYLEVVSEVVQEVTTQEENQTENSNNTSDSEKKVTAKTTVNIRKSPSETGEKLGSIYQGESVELITNQADGWSKIKYKGQTAYVKTEFVE